MKLDRDDIKAVCFFMICGTILLSLIVFGFMYPMVIVIIILLILFVVGVAGMICGAYLFFSDLFRHYCWFIDEKSKVISKKVNNLLKPKRIAFYLRLISTLIVLLIVLISLLLIPSIVFSIISTSLSSIILNYLSDNIAAGLAGLVFFGIGLTLLFTGSFIEKYFMIKMNHPEYLKEYKGWSKIKHIKDFSEDKVKKYF